MAPRKRKAAEEVAAEEEAPVPKATAASGSGRAQRSGAKRSAAATKPAAAATKRRRVAAKKGQDEEEPAAAPVPLAAGHCFTFGTNPFGALGLGEDATEKPRAAAVDLRLPGGGAPAPVVQVVAGGMHTAALGAGGEVFTWGVNDEGALGRPTAGSAWEGHPDGEKEDPCLPGLARLPPDAPRAVRLAAGDGFTFALGADGSLWGWGCFKDDGSGAAGFPGAEGKLQRLPARVYAPSDDAERVEVIAAGARHMAALTRGGGVLTWGMGSQGQLGRVAPFNNDSFPPLPGLLTPAPVPGLAELLGGSPPADVACGAYTTFVISRRGGVAAWGLNNAGQLALPLAGDAAAAAAAAGGQQQQQVEGQQQQKEWAGEVAGDKGGDGGSGAALANGDAAGAPDQQQEQQQQQPAAAAASEEAGAGHFHWAPRRVDALSRVAAIAGGEAHTLALTRAGRVLSFGAPTYGMLGRSNVDAGASSSAEHAPHLVDLTDGLGAEAVVGVAAGTNVSAAVTKQGNLFLWGSNVNYQMAKGLDDDDNHLPTRMRRHKAFGQRRVLAAAFGGQHGVLLASGDAAAAE